MRYLLVTAVGGYFFYTLSLWDLIGVAFAAMFLLASLVGLLYRDRSRRPIEDEEHEDSV